MRLIKRLIERGYMRRAGQLNSAMWNLESGKRKRESNIFGFPGQLCLRNISKIRKQKGENILQFF